MMADVSQFANLFGGCGAAQVGVAGRPARGGACNCVPQTDRRLVDSFEASEDYLHLANQLGINYSTARNIIRVWLQDGRVETQRQGGAHNAVVTGAMDEAIGEIALAAPFTTLTSMRSSSCCSDFLMYQSLCQQWHDIWMAMASQLKLLARMQTFLSNATVQRQLSGEDSVVSGWQASTIMANLH